jgi:hypothetical protein
MVAGSEELAMGPTTFILLYYSNSMYSLTWIDLEYGGGE